MTTDSQDTRYRNGYAAGQRDAASPVADALDTPDRLETGDPWSDLGYEEGFADRQAMQHATPFRQTGEMLSQVFWLPEIAGWARRFSRNVRGQA
jgi:hypothetical protein